MQGASPSCLHLRSFQIRSLQHDGPLRLRSLPHHNSMTLASCARKVNTDILTGRMAHRCILLTRHKRSHIAARVQMHRLRPGLRSLVIHMHVTGGLPGEELRGVRSLDHIVQAIDGTVRFGKQWSSVPRRKSVRSELTSTDCCWHLIVLIVKFYRRPDDPRCQPLVDDERLAKQVRTCWHTRKVFSRDDGVSWYPPQSSLRSSVASQVSSKDPL